MFQIATTQYFRQWPAPIALCALLLLAGCNGDDSSTPTPSDQSLRALSFGMPTGSVAVALADRLTFDMYNGSQSPNLYDLVIVDGDLIGAPDLQDSGSADTLVDAAMKAGRPVLMLDAEVNEAQALLEEHGMSVPEHSNMLWIEPSADGEGHRVLHIPATLHTADQPLTTAEADYTFPDDPNPDLSAEELLLDAEHGPAAYIVRRLQERKVSGLDVQQKHKIAAGDKEDFCDIFANSSACIKTGMAFKYGQIVVNQAYADTNQCLKGHLLQNTAGILVPLQSDPWNSENMSCSNSVLTPSNQGGSEPGSYQCPSSTITIDYYVFLATNPDQTREQFVLLRMNGSSIPSSADTISKNDWWGRFWTTSGVGITAEASWVDTGGKDGLVYIFASPDNFVSNNDQTKVTSSHDYSFDFKGSAKGSCKVSTEIGEDSNIGGECGLGVNGSAGGSFSYKYSETKTLADWRLVNKTVGQQQRYRWYYSQNLPYEGWPRNRFEVLGDTYNWFILPQSIKDIPRLSREALSTNGFAEFKVDSAHIGRKLKVNLEFTGAYDATICIIHPLFGRTCNSNLIGNGGTPLSQRISVI
jgi:hypothetical protein